MQEWRILRHNPLTLPPRQRQRRHRLRRRLCDRLRFWRWLRLSDNRHRQLGNRIVPPAALVPQVDAAPLHLADYRTASYATDLIRDLAGA